MYIVEGNIGAGKSTLLALLAKHLPYTSVCFEPREQWQQEDGQSLLTRFYQDPHRWAFTMETVAMIWRVRNHLLEQQHQNQFRIMERSVYSGHYVFGYNDYAQGFMTQLEWELYLQFFNFMMPPCKAPQGFIYLHTDPEIAFERMQKRNRGSESTVPLDYLQQIDARHKAFLIDKVDVLPELKNVPVLTIDCNNEFESDPATQALVVAQIEQFLHATKMNLTQSSKSDACQL
jgi:deoxyguanosine kinase